MPHKPMFAWDPLNGNSGFDTAQYCLNGHRSNSCYHTAPEGNQEYCTRCGSKTIIACPVCDAQIRGYRFDSSGFGFSSTTLPRCCYNCGSPYPWTSSALDAAREMALELEDLSPEEREALAGTLDDLVADGPMTTVAVTRFKKLAAKAGGPAASAFRDVLVNVISESARRAIYGV